MQDVIVADWLRPDRDGTSAVRLGFWPAVPGNRQRLEPPVGKLDQVLLHRIEAESVLYLEDRQLAVRSVGLDEELSVLRKKRDRTP